MGAIVAPAIVLTPGANPKYNLAHRAAMGLVSRRWQATIEAYEVNPQKPNFDFPASLQALGARSTPSRGRHSIANRRTCCFAEQLESLFYPFGNVRHVCRMFLAPPFATHPPSGSYFRGGTRGRERYSVSNRSDQVVKRRTPDAPAFLLYMQVACVRKPLMKVS